jgi:hypothetical protein
MVDLSRTEAQMLADIDWKSTLITPGVPPQTDALWRVTGRTPDELLTILQTALSRRYAHVLKPHVSADLIYLVKKGLGNAYKWGNERDSEKLIAVTMVMTDIGAVIRISDQGKGFDVARVVEQFTRHERYFVHGGSGFSHFHNARSIISYADGGRTLLIRFLCHEQDDKGAHHSNSNGGNPKGSKKRWIELTHLKLHDHVKLKGAITPDGRFTASKISLTPVEELAFIHAQLRHVENNGRRGIRVLNANLTLSDSTQIVDVESGPLDFGALRAGQVIELTGGYSFEEGFCPTRLQILSESYLGATALKGRIEGTIEEINQSDGTVRVLGMTVATDDRTELFDKR